MYQYRAQVERVVDADTIDVNLDMGFYTTMRMRLRIRGIDAPEMRGPERPEGLVSTAFVNAHLPPGCNVVVRTYKVGKYGRFIADVAYVEGDPRASVDEILEGGVDLAEELLAAGLAVAE